MPRYVVIRTDPDHYCVEIPLHSRHISTVVNILNLLGIPAVGRNGGAGWILDDGCLSISGRKPAVENALNQIDLAINGPKFETGLDVAARHKKGALP